MSKNSVFIFPPAYPNAANPFINNLRESLINNGIEVKGFGRHGVTGLAKYLFTTNVYILNWPENIIFGSHGKIKYYLFKIIVFLFTLKGGKIIWFLHNLEPHEGHNRYTKATFDYLFKKSSANICFSKAAYELSNKNAPVGKSYYFPHPFKNFGYAALDKTKTCDVLIWGSIIPYKGILEFLKAKPNIGAYLKILIVGRCKDASYESKIRQYENENVIIENRFIDFGELQELIAKSRYVVFPYLSGSVSSSGALMDTLQYGGNVIGPNIGAFKDLADNKVILAYNDMNDIFQIINNGVYCSDWVKKTFVETNIWNVFGSELKNIIQKLYD